MNWLMIVGLLICALWPSSTWAGSGDIPQRDLERLAVMQIEHDNCELNQERAILAEIKRLARKYQADPDEFRAMVGQLSASATRYVRPVTMMHYCGERQSGGPRKRLDEPTR